MEKIVQWLKKSPDAMCPPSAIGHGKEFSSFIPNITNVNSTGTPSTNDFWSSCEYRALKSRTDALLNKTVVSAPSIAAPLPPLLTSQIWLNGVLPPPMPLPLPAPRSTLPSLPTRKLASWMLPNKQRAKEILKEPIQSPPLKSQYEFLQKLPQLLLPQSVCDTANGLAATVPDASHKCHKCMCPLCLVAAFGKLVQTMPQKLHFCWRCTKLYGKTSHLSAHLRNHSNTRPYKCHFQSCEKAFTRSDELQRHIRTHTGEKKFQCLMCGKRFMRSDHLSKHRKTHRPPMLSEPSEGLNAVVGPAALPVTCTVAAKEDSMMEDSIQSSELAPEGKGRLFLGAREIGISNSRYSIKKRRPGRYS